MKTYVPIAPDVPPPTPFDHVRHYPHHWRTSLYLYALGGSIFSDDGLTFVCRQYDGAYITQLKEDSQ